MVTGVTAKVDHLPNTTPANRVRALDAAVIAAVYATSFFVVAGFPHILKGFPLDDSWIHQVIARNLIQCHTLGFIPGVWSSGSSSLLWTLILAIKWLAAPSFNPVVYCGVLGLLCLIAIGIGLLAIARKDGQPEYLCWLMALTPAFDGNFVWLGLIGMEHLLFVALSITGIYFWFCPGRRSALAAALCLGALSLTRPEGLVLAFILACVSRWSGRNRKDIALLGSVVSACVFLFLAANLKTSHSWLPMTYAGRKWLYFGSVRVPLKNSLMFPYSDLLYDLRPWIYFGTNLLFAPVAVLEFFGIYRLVRFKTPRTAALCAWMLALVGIYAIMLPSLFHDSRYQSLFLCLALPLLFTGLDGLLSISRVSTKVRIPLLATLCFICAVESLWIWREETRAGIQLIFDTHERAAALIAREVPPDAKVAALDIGALGYLDGAGRIEDLGGLTDTSYLPYLQRHRIMDYLDNRQVAYVMWVSNPDGSSARPDFLVIGKRFERLALFCTGIHEWEISRNQPQCQSVYRIADR